MSILCDYDEYLKQHPDVRSWMANYRPHKILPFEPMVRSYIAIQLGLEMAKFFGKDKS